MRALLAVSRLIDRVNLAIGRGVSWLTLVVVLIAAGNAASRKFLQSSSNAWLELQWYLFGALFLLASGYTLLKNGHVRVDVLSSRLPRRAQVGIEIFGTLVFLLPVFGLIAWLSWPMFVEAFVSGEVSSNSGGLVRWPVKLLIPVGLGLLIAAAVSHLIKCAGFLLGACPDPMRRESAATDEELLAAELAERLRVDERGTQR
ncbi:MAG: TRAP transporter small permease subunit [Lautropia sp.]